MHELGKPSDYASALRRLLFGKHYQQCATATVQVQQQVAPSPVLVINYAQMNQPTQTEP
jgi:hypothetical protein